MLIDQALIFVKAGKGGDGKVAFRRAKYINKGGPNGGDGGCGGDIVFLADPGVDTLLDFAGRHFWQAQDGEPGGIKQCTGANGNDLLIHVPPGTQIFDQDQSVMIVDLDQPGMKAIIAHGGRGGFGNEHFKTSTHQTPYESTPGQPGQEKNLRLELKLIADVGLVGKPNAGKSTFLARVSRAQPKIADYPFTTIEPQLGIAEIAGQRRLVIADLPGLIQGASQGHGLGTKFLRHIERTRLLIHLLEIDPTDGSNPVENYRVIRQELESYSPALAAKPQMVVLSKIDLLGTADDVQAAAEMVQQELGLKVWRISAATGEGIPPLLEAAWPVVQQQREASSSSLAQESNP